MVLALEALEIATHRRHGERGRPWKKMEDWLLFDRVHIERDRTAVDESVKFSIPVLSNPTETPFRMGDDTSMITEGTLHLPIA
jgi:hypothetical protein